MARYVGLDAHSKNCVYAIQDEHGTMQGEGRVPTTPEGLALMRVRHDLEPGTPVALESGTMAFYVARRLSAIGMAPVVIDAHEVRGEFVVPSDDMLDRARAGRERRSPHGFRGVVVCCGAASVRTS